MRHIHKKMKFSNLCHQSVGMEPLLLPVKHHSEEIDMKNEHIIDL